MLRGTLVVIMAAAVVTSVVGWRSNDQGARGRCAMEAASYKNASACNVEQQGHEPSHDRNDVPTYDRAAAASPWQSPVRRRQTMRLLSFGVEGAFGAAKRGSPRINAGSL